MWLVTQVTGHSKCNNITEVLYVTGYDKDDKELSLREVKLKVAFLHYAELSAMHDEIRADTVRSSSRNDMEIWMSKWE